MACYFLENHSRIARLKQPSFENLENAVSRGGSLRKAAPLLGIESLNVLYFPFSEATPLMVVIWTIEHWISVQIMTWPLVHFYLLNVPLS